MSGKAGQDEGAARRAPDWAHHASLVVVPTLECNLRCSHCFIGRPAGRAPMSAATLARLLDDARRLGFESIEITGGEFFSWPHAAAAADALRAAGVPLTIVTNGTLVEEPTLAAWAGSRVRLCLSLDGPPSVHDTLRGQGVFARLRRTAELCRRHRVPFVVACTVLRSTVVHVEETARTALELGASAAWFGPFQRLGGAGEAIADQVLDDEGCVELLARLTALRLQAPPGFEVSAHNFGLRARAVDHPCDAYACWGQGCMSPKYWPSVVGVTSDGLVLPQSMHCHEQYALGRVGADGLGPLVERYWGSAQHEAFRRLTRHVFRDLILPDRRACYFWDELVRTASKTPRERLPAYVDVPHPYDHSDELARLGRPRAPRSTSGPRRSVR